MYRIKTFIAAILLLGLTASCNIPRDVNISTETVSVPLPPTATVESEPPTPRPVLSAETLRSADYALPVYEKHVTLVDGTFQGDEEPDKLRVTLLPQIAWGDLDGDGLEDAVVLLAENNGGSGVFVSLLVMVNNGGQPRQSAAVLVDDRPRIDSLEINNGSIIMQGVIHAADDVMAIPTLAVTEIYRYSAGSGDLDLVNFASGKIDGMKHIIRMERPVDGQEIGGTLRIVGDMPVGPFENNLRFRVYGLNGDVLIEEPFGVESEDMGMPASFDKEVNLAAIPPDSTIRIELAELSMKDGSLMSMASVRGLKVDQ